MRFLCKGIFKMHWEVVKDLIPEEFRRLTSVKKQTFEEMLNILKLAR